MHQRTGVWRVGDDGVLAAGVAITIQCVQSGAYVAFLDARQAEAFEMSDQLAVAAARFGEPLGAVEVRDQRLYRGERSCVKI
jgi:hypothetical protein